MSPPQISLICSKCADANGSVQAVTISDGNALCAICFGESRPELMTPAELAKLKKIRDAAKAQALKAAGRKFVPASPLADVQTGTGKSDSGWGIG